MNRLALDRPPCLELRRRVPALLAATLAISLAACGGGGGGGSSSGGSSSSSGGSSSGSSSSGGTAGSFYLSGEAGAGSGIGLTSLLAVNPTTEAQATLAGQGAWSDEASIVEWTAGSSGASSIGTRYRVYADTSGYLQSADLSLAGAVPTTTQLSSSTTANLCPTWTGTPVAPNAPTVLNDFANPANSLLVYRTGTCGSTTDLFTVVPLSATASTTLAAASLTEPVDAVHSSSGALATLLLLVHGGSSAQVAYAASASATPTVIGTLAGSGLSANGGDFQSLAVVPQADGSAVWLWRDAGFIEAAKIPAPGGSGTPAIIQVYGAQDSDNIAAPALVDGTNVYVGLTDTSSPTNRIVRVDTTAISGGSAASTVLSESVSGGTGIQLVGIAGPNVVYQYSNLQALKVVAKTATGATAGTVVWTQGAAGQTLDAIYAPVLVGSAVYFCVTTATTSQAYYYGGSGSPAAIGSASQVLGGVAAAPMPIGNSTTPSYGAAIVAVFDSSATAASPYTKAAINSYDAANAATTLGTLPTPTTSQFQGVTLSSGLAQAGQPTLLVLNGYFLNNTTGGPGTDLFQVTPGSAGSLTRITTYLP